MGGGGFLKSNKGHCLKMFGESEIPQCSLMLHGVAVILSVPSPLIKPYGIAICFSKYAYCVTMVL